MGGNAIAHYDLLTLKVPIKICSRQHLNFLLIIIYSSEKISLDKLMIHMKCEDFIL